MLLITTKMNRFTRKCDKVIEDCQKIVTVFVWMALELAFLICCPFIAIPFIIFRVWNVKRKDALYADPQSSKKDDSQ